MAWEALLATVVDFQIAHLTMEAMVAQEPLVEILEFHMGVYYCH
jgi:hypothetical protein